MEVGIPVHFQFDGDAVLLELQASRGYRATPENQGKRIRFLERTMLGKDGNQTLE